MKYAIGIIKTTSKINSLFLWQNKHATKAVIIAAIKGPLDALANNIHIADMPSPT